ncbi:hypothetical protein Tco_0413399 [Tanacetum coccineum]
MGNLGSSATTPSSTSKGTSPQSTVVVVRVTIISCSGRVRNEPHDVDGAEERPHMLLDKTIVHLMAECIELQDDYDVQATNIVLQGLPPDVYSIVNHCQSAKDIWDSVKLLMQGTKLPYQERECKLYNKFDKFTSIKGDDLIACLNKVMAFMSTMMASHFPSINNQLKASSNPRNQATIQDGRVTSSKGNIAAGQARVVKCYNCQDPRIPDGQAIQTTIPQNAAFQTDDLDAYDSDCDDISSAKAILMANISSYGSDDLSKMMSEQMSNHVTNWDKVNQETKFVNESLTAELGRYKERVKTFDQRLNVDLSSREKLIDSQMDDMIQNRNALK